MKKISKILLVSAAIFLLAAGCDLGNRQQATGGSTQNTVNSTQQTAGNQNQAQNQVADDRPWITQAVEGSNINQPKTQFTQGQSAMDVLEATHQVESKEYSGLGKMVISIDGKAADSKHFWEFFVNGKSSNVGASSYKLQENDKIEWKLSTINSYGK